ncbi:MAG: glycosyltransferase family 39 protein [Verrucomicrobia bacterium]|nr:glycosyltransferase family 39 protein [Verrucomicrobiota bacterium]
MSQSVQELIHNFEVGAGRKIFAIVVAVVLLIGLAIFFDTFFYRNLTTPEGMESAQLARNIAEGKGYVTGLMRPLDIRLLQKTEKPADLRVKDATIPDLQNPPLYPVILAGWLKLLPWTYRIQGDANTFTRYNPDLWITVLHQVFLLWAIYLIYSLGARLFDATAGCLCAALLAGTWLYWQMAFTGHGGLLLVVISLLLGHCLARAEESTEGATPSPKKLLLWGILAGVCVGLGALTRYSYIWMIVPVFLFFCFPLSGPRFTSGAAAAVAVAIVFTPWMARNIQVSGSPFGSAGHAIYQGTETFPEDSVERALYPNFESFNYHEVRRKAVNNAREMLLLDLPRWGGNWMAIVSLVGLLLPFRRPSLSRLRWFIVGSVVVLFIAQAGGKSYLSRENPDVTSENLLAWIAPLGFIFGVGFTMSLVDQMAFSHPGQKPLLLGAITILCCFPMLFSIVRPYPYVSAVVYPPYFPPILQRIGRMDESGSKTLWDKEVVMSDVPAAVTWYSRCASMPLSLNYRAEPAEKVKDDFFELSDYRREIKALYLTQRTLKSAPVKGVADAGKGTRSKWEHFVGAMLIQRKVPEGFPLQGWADFYWPEQLYLEMKTR